MICCDCTNDLPPDDFPRIADLSRKSKRCLPCTREMRAKEATGESRRRGWVHPHKSFGRIPLHDSLQRPKQRLSEEDLHILKQGLKHDTD